MNGANRLGSNSLSEILVFGARAGMQAAQDCVEAAVPASNPLESLAEAEEERLVASFLGKKGGHERVAAIRRDLQATMEKAAGIYRSEELLKQGVEEVRRLRERYRDLSLDDRDRAFNTELVSAMELDNMLDVAEAVLASGLERRESRGSHTRRDYPERDDEQFAKHSLAFSTPEGPRIEYSDVTITRWPPEERKY
jgi:succinate dehydrogenase/fumarate reductase flavoprotein subunit